MVTVRDSGGDCVSWVRVRLGHVSSATGCTPGAGLGLSTRMAEPGVEKGRDGGSSVGFFRLVESPPRFGRGMYSHPLATETPPVNKTVPQHNTTALFLLHKKLSTVSIDSLVIAA